MKKLAVIVAGVGLVGALAIGLGSCGGTGGSPGEADTGTQFVNTFCNPDQECLSLVVRNRSLDPFEESRFEATLVDPFGVPHVNERICFSLETPDAATIFEPAGNCGFTDSNGRISGGLRSTGNRSGSILFNALAESRNLRAQQMLKFNVQCFLNLRTSTSSLADEGSAFLTACVDCSDATRLVGEPITLDGCANPAECTLNPTVVVTGTDGCAQSTILNTLGGAASQETVTATSPDAGSDSVNFILSAAGTTLGVKGDACTAGSECESGACGGPGVGCLGDGGDPCVAAGECASNTCLGNNTCAEP